MSFQIEHVISQKREDVTDEQWKQVQKMFPGMFRKVQSTRIENLSDEAKKIIADSDLKE